MLSWRSIVFSTMLLHGCFSAPNSLRTGSPLDGRWIASVASPNCGVEEKFPVTISGRTFGERIPGTDILLSGIEQSVGRNSISVVQPQPQTKGYGSPEVVRVFLDFETSRLGRGAWQSSRCSGTLVLGGVDELTHRV